MTHAQTRLRISVIGCGYLGAVHAAAMAHLGHEVVGIDTDAERIASLAAGRAPFFEPGLEDLLASTLAEGHLRFTTDPEAAADAQVHFVCVGTPQRADSGAADLSYLHAAMKTLRSVARPGSLVVGKSTVPVGTAAALVAELSLTRPDLGLLWNPEFLREGFAIKDTLEPDRLVYGLQDGPASVGHRQQLDAVYGPLLDRTQVVVTDLATAELVKVAANSFLAMKISFINAMAQLCDATGADVVDLADALGHDARIGRRFLGAGLGFGGGCLPKDIRAFQHRATELDADLAADLVSHVDRINLAQRDLTVSLVSDWFDGDVSGRRITVLGAAFKPNSDDVRDSPALAVARVLHAAGALVTVTDPEAIAPARRVAPELTYVSDVVPALEGAEAVLLLTEWAEYVDLDPHQVGNLVCERRVFDGRLGLDPAKWAAAGWHHRSIGRPDHQPVRM